MAEVEEARIPGFGGGLIGPDHERYDDARSIWNLMHDRSPALIAQCSDAADVAAAITYARSKGLTIAVRGGGHSLPGFSAIDGGLVIDLRGINQVIVDPATRRVRVGGGGLLGDVDASAQAHGLVVPAGVVSHTGVGGLTLGGGVGRLMRRFGLTIDSLLRAEVVLADGRIVTASEDQHPDLFWALRGGGGNFGVVTEFEFKAYELTVLPVLACFCPLGRVGDVLRMGDRLMADPATPRELLWTSFLRRGPKEAPWMTPEYEGQPGIMSLIEWSGELEQGHDLLEQIKQELQPELFDLADAPYLALQTLTDEMLAPGTLHAYLKAGYADELSEEMIVALIDRGSQVGSPLSVIEVLSVGGAIRDVAADATPFAHRGARWLINIAGQWRDPQETERERSWVRGSYAALQPYLGAGVYSNFLEDDEPGAAGSAYGAAFPRLAQIKAVYDPENVFSRNQNIVPVLA